MSKIPKNKYPYSGVIEYDYNYDPKTTIIINYYTSVDTMIKTINNIRSIGNELEIIVNNDKNGNNSEKIMKALSHRNDRMVCCNDLAEKEGYHHGARLSNSSDFLIFTQDDDLAPPTNEWYLDCIKEFDNDPKLGMIGLLKGGFNYAQTDNVTLKDKFDKVYVSWLATGPLMIRKDLYFKIGGWSKEYGQIGESDGGSDADMATKVILNGFKSMLLRVPSVKEWKRRFKRGDGKSDKEIKFGNQQRVNRITLNNKIYYEKYKDEWNKIYNIVEKQNAEIGLDIKNIL